MLCIPFGSKHKVRKKIIRQRWNEIILYIKYVIIYTLHKQNIYTYTLFLPSYFWLAFSCFI